MSENLKPREWYKKKRFMIPATIIGLSFATIGSSPNNSSTPVDLSQAAQAVASVSVTSSTTEQISSEFEDNIEQPKDVIELPDLSTTTLNSPQKSEQVTSPAPTKSEIKTESYATAKEETPNEAAVVKSNTSTFSNDNYYTNVDGERVKSPTYTSDNSIPAGASARCRDGTYSFSKNRRGTCSSHGGVATWY